MKINSIKIIMLLGMFICAFGVSVGNDYSKDAMEYSDFCDQDECAILKEKIFSVNIESCNLLSLQQQISKENLIRYLFHPPR